MSVTAIHYTLKLYIIPQRTYINKVLPKLKIYEIFHELVKACFSFVVVDCLIVCLFFCCCYCWVFFFYIKTSIFRVLELPLCTCIYVQCSITEYILTETWLFVFRHTWSTAVIRTSLTAISNTCTSFLLKIVNFTIQWKLKISTFVLYFFKRLKAN